MSLIRISGWSFRNRWAVIAIWVGVLVGLSVGAAAVGDDFTQDFKLPGTESQLAFDLLTERFPDFAGDDVTVVFSTDAALTDSDVKKEVASTLAKMAKVDHIVSAADPYNPAPGAGAISPDGKIAYASLRLDAPASLALKEEALELVDYAKSSTHDGFQVEVGGYLIQGSEQPQPGAADMLGLVAALLILLFTFRSVLAAGLPIAVALFGIGVATAILTFFTHLINVPDFAPMLASMIGLGVGIDYALFIVTRYREGLAVGMEPQAAVSHSMTTAGRSVMFAGVTVVISMLGILLMNFAFVEGVAIGGAVVVLATMIGSITLLPALLGFAGRNVDKFALPGLRSHEHRGEQSFWYRWSRVIQRRPLAGLIVALGIMLTLSFPLLSMRLGNSDSGNESIDYSNRRAYDLIAEGFGPGYNGPFLLAAEISGPSDLDALGRAVDAISGTDGVAFASPPFANEAGDAAIVRIIPTDAPQDEATSDLVHHLRDDVIPNALRDSTVVAHIGGSTAIGIDFADQASERLPIFIGVVISLSFLLLLAVFRSIVVPIKAAIMNLLSIGAAYGVVVAIFQWGWMGDLIGIGKEGPIEPWAPMMLFAILFGLSMDYEVFLISRMREEYVEHGDNAVAVANGLATTARVITAAAAIMIAVFVAFIFLTPIRPVKVFAIGLATAIFVDATVVRMVLVPATMELLGNANWWIPKWLDRILPHIAIEKGSDLGAASVEAAELAEQ